jgi:hypothetical protein
MECVLWYRLYRNWESLNPRIQDVWRYTHKEAALESVSRVEEVFTGGHLKMSIHPQDLGAVG